MGKMTLLLVLLINSFLMLIPMSCAIELTPAIIWGGDSFSPNFNDENPLHRTSTLDFQKIVENKIGTTYPPVLVFIKDKLCMEDITRNPNKDFKELKTIENLQMYSSVESASSAFENLSSYNQSTEDKPSTISDGQLIFTYVSDIDTVISTYKNLKESNTNLIAALIGESCIYSKTERRKRAVDDNKNSTNAFIFPGKFKSRVLLYTSQPLYFQELSESKITKVNLTMDNLVSAQDSGTNDTKSPLIVSMGFNTEGNPTFKFEFKIEYPGYYALKKIEYLKNGNAPAVVLKPNNVIDVPAKFSYHCGPGVNFTSANVSLFFTNVQIEVDAVNSKFREAYDCVGFMSIPILSGIFVTLIMALIMIWGISIIMDIRTMDRFDDPKGKTITISASE